MAYPIFKSPDKVYTSILLLVISVLPYAKSIDVPTTIFESKYLLNPYPKLNYEYVLSKTFEFEIPI